MDREINIKLKGEKGGKKKEWVRFSILSIKVLNHVF
jgi:hypothetical protein